MREKMVVQHEKEWQAKNYPETDFELVLIEKYLADKGYTLADLKDLPPEQTNCLYSEACQYASLKLTEIESTMDVWNKVRGVDSSS